METWLANSFKNLTEEDEFTDCCISVESRIFRCHKVILGVASEFFKRSFLSGFKESSTGEIHLTNVKAETFEKFRLYAYTYSKNTLNGYSNEDIISLMECANMWMVEPLKAALDEIINRRMPQMSFSDLILYFEFAHHIADKDLIKLTSAQMNTLHARHGEFPDEIFQLGSDVIREFLITLTNMREIIRYQVVEKYVAIHGFVLNLNDTHKWEFHGLAKKSNENESDGYANPNPFTVEKLNLSSDTDGLSVSPDPRPKKINSEYVKSLLSLVNYKNMTAKEFYDGPGKSIMMTFEEKFNLLYSIVQTRDAPTSAFGATPFGATPFSAFGQRR